MKFEAAKDYIMDRLRRELPQHLSYHSVEHVKDVYSAAERYAEAEGISGEDRVLLLTAVLFHDSGFLVQQKEHERISCEIASEHLLAYGYTPEQIQRICGMIMATKVPQDPHNLLEQIICDADLDYLGREDFFAIGNRLFAELSVYGLINSEEEWNKLQVRFLESHHYFTASAIRWRQATKAAHLASIRSQIRS
jgi:predicted metal-dependent HD superfamily phosphohydrolase